MNTTGAFCSLTRRRFRRRRADRGLVSLREAAWNTGSAFFISLAAEYFVIGNIVRAAGVYADYPGLAAVLITSFYTLLSFLRVFVIRRFRIMRGE